MALVRILGRFRKTWQKGGQGTESHRNALEGIEAVHGVGPNGRRLLVDSFGENLPGIISHLNKRGISIEDSVDLLLRMVETQGNQKDLIEREGTDLFVKKLLELKKKEKI
ncbi:MAG: hypothetical protein ABIA76_03985 [Candidatus Diapherotrites archaeon]